MKYEAKINEKDSYDQLMYEDCYRVTLRKTESELLP